MDARAASGQWLVRIEDIDPPRCPEGADSTILRQLEAFGLTWDGEVIWQSHRHDAYQHALDQLVEQGLAYPCSCSRKQWQAFDIYPGWCRNGVCDATKPVAWRLRSDLAKRPVGWNDRLFGEQHFDPAELGDVVLKRKDQLWAYQLAVVVDDAHQGITNIVRGYDLLDNTPWQQQLQAALSLPTPRYLHTILVMPWWASSTTKPVAWRLRSDLAKRPVGWNDRLFGEQHFDPAELGDVVLKRKDQLWAYQLAVVVDDAHQGITNIVRGYDLLDNTPWQQQLQAALSLPTPRYLHLPLVVTTDGQKLSKQNLAPALAEESTGIRRQLFQALQLLDQAPPPALVDESPEAQLRWAIENWTVSRLAPLAHRPTLPEQ